MAETMLAGVELGGTKCVCVLATPSGEILAQERVDTEAPDVSLPRIRAVLRQWFGEGHSIGAVGVAAVGPSGEAASERRLIIVPDVFEDASLEDWQEVAGELGRSPAEVALAWVNGR